VARAECQEGMPRVSQPDRVQSVSIPAGSVSESIEESHGGVARSATPTETSSMEESQGGVGTSPMPTETSECLELGCPSKVGSEVMRQKLARSQKEDPSLEVCRGLGERAERGYRYKDDILRHVVLDIEDEEFSRIVLPKCERKRVLELAHDKCGHVGIKKVRAMINRCFTWPGMGDDIIRYVKSCDVCARANKAGNRAVKCLERPVVSEPFTSVAIDIVGP